MKKTINSKHIGSMVVYTLLSLFLCMAGVGNASAAEQLNPVVKINKTSYTSSGTEVTLRLWMFNMENTTTITRSYNARFTGDVNLYIDDQVVIKLNSIWSSIADATIWDINTAFNDNPVDINLDGTNVGTAQFQDLKRGQTCPYNSNTTEKSWYTVDLKFSFNKSFSYYGHKITVKGKWEDKSSFSSVVEKDVVLDNDIDGFVRPINMSAQHSGDKTMFTWEQQGYNSSASTDGKWVVYKREGDNNVKLGEVAANEHSLSIEKKQYSCSKDYIMTFLPNVCEGEETVCGLTTTFTATGHQINDEICQMCGHSWFRYQTSDGNTVDISNKDFGAKVVAHKVVDGKWVIEFDAPITKIPAKAFSQCYNLTGNLVIPNSVTEIGYRAFKECYGFTGDLTIPNSVTTIGNSAFDGCYGFTGDLTIPNSVKTIGYSVFYNCHGFKGKLTIPNSVKTIGMYAFYNCTGFTGNLSLPKSLEVVENHSFDYCNNIQTIKLQSLPTGIGDLNNNKTVSLSDDSYISDKASGTVKKISYTRTMTSKWGTLVLPYPLTLTGNEPYRLYKIEKLTEDELVLSRLEGVVDAGTPCVVKRNGEQEQEEMIFMANNATLNMTIQPIDVTELNFHGTYQAKEVTNGYIIRNDLLWNVEMLKAASPETEAIMVGPFRS
uniref:leucine-rich repeat domain-containing protein n=1 Tax=Prevotella sp. TaxID=59823 RepID=UPI00307EA30B